MAAAATVVIASGIGLPISTTHTLVGAVLGVGLARGIGALNLRVMVQANPSSGARLTDHAAIRVQQREDGIMWDQLVISANTYRSSSPGSERSSPSR